MPTVNKRNSKLTGVINLTCFICTYIQTHSNTYISRMKITLSKLYGNHSLYQFLCFDITQFKTWFYGKSMKQWCSLFILLKPDRKLTENRFWSEELEHWKWWYTLILYQESFCQNPWSCQLHQPSHQASRSLIFSLFSLSSLFTLFHKSWDLSTGVKLTPDGLFVSSVTLSRFFPNRNGLKTDLK